MFSLIEILDLALRLEKNGEEFYRSAAGKFTDRELRNLLEWLAEEEVRHKDWFHKIREEALAKGKEDPSELKGREILVDILGDQRFSLADVDLSAIQEAEEVLSIAEEFERDTIVFFEMILSLASDHKTIETLRQIIEEENRHVLSIRKYLHREKKDNL